MKNNILQKRIRPWHIIGLPLWWLTCIQDNANLYWKKAKRNPSSYYIIQYGAFLSICYNDRTFIDEVLDEDLDARVDRAKIPAQIYCEIGMALFDQGYKTEGLSYLEKAAKICPSSEYTYTWLFCTRLNRINDWDKRLKFAERLAKCDPDEHNAIAMLLKSYIDKKLYDQATDLIEKVIGEQNDYSFMLAEFNFAQGNFKAAAEAYEKYKLPTLCHFWRPQYNYKKALAFHYSDQPKKMRNQALKIKRRLKWDRFYRLNDLEDEGIQRETVIDEIINSDEPDRILIDPEKASHYLKAIAFILKACVCSL